MPLNFILACLGFILLGPVACTKKTDAVVNPVDRGRSVYAANCTACHNANPRLDGAVGPAIHGSSLELLEARVLRAAYPAGYKPKRETHLMPAMPFLKDDIPALHAYLNSP